MSDLTHRGQQAGPKDLQPAGLADQAELRREPGQPLDVLPVFVVRPQEGRGEQIQQAGVFGQHQERQVAEDVVEHVGLGGEIQLLP